MTGKANNEDLDLYAYKLKLLDGYRKAAAPANSRGKIGIPLCPEYVRAFAVLAHAVQPPRL